MTGISFYSVQLYVSRNYLLNNSTSTRVFFFLVLSALIIYCATGDYWSYRIWYEDGFESIHFEPIWERLRSIIPWGFNIFKLVLWGGGLILFTIMCKWNKADLIISYTLFALFYMINYTYARASVAYMLILFANYLIIRIKGKSFIRSFCFLSLAALCIWLGLQMHRSMPILLALLAISLLLTPQKKTIVFLLVFFPAILFIFNTILYNFIVDYVSNDGEMYRLMNVYLYEDKRGLTAFIKQLFNHLPMLLLFFVSLINILKKENIHSYVKRIAFAAFVIVYFAFVFYALKEANGLALFYRTMNMAYPFMIMSIAYSMKYVNSMYYLTIIVVVVKILYTFLVIYQILANPDYLYNQVFERYFY